jgi:hypothetical protein
MDSPQPPPPPPGAWPPPPGPPPQQPWAAPVQPPFSGLAVAAFVTSLFVLFPLALVLGLVALTRLNDGDAQQRRQRGKGLATAAVALACVQIAVLAVVVPVAVFNADDDGGGGSAAAAPQDERAGEDAEDSEDTESPSPTESDEPGGAEDGEEIDVYSIRTGDCFDSGTGLDQFEENEATEEFRVTRLACDGAHEAEAFGSTRVTGYDAFPGDEELTRLATEECGGRVQPYVLDAWNLDRSVTYFFYYPQQSSWSFGDREILCFFGNQDGSPLTGSLRGDAGDFGEEQTRYLEITAPLESVIWQEPLPGAPLAEHRAWAGQMSRTITEEADALSRASWSAEISGLVDDLVAAREVSVSHWDRAADAGGQAAYDRHYGDGYATLGVETEISIRETLGLSTSLQ